MCDEEWAPTPVEAENFHSLPSRRWRPRRVVVWFQSRPKGPRTRSTGIGRREMNIPAQAESKFALFYLFVLCRPWAAWVRPAHFTPPDLDGDVSQKRPHRITQK